VSERRPELADLRLEEEARADGSTRLHLRLGDRSISRLAIVPITIRIGAAAVRMDGIGGVGTDDEFRRQGLSRRLLEAAVTRMRSGDAALSMLYGIPDYYTKFGFATAGPDFLLALKDAPGEVSLPAGWSERPARPEDLPRLQAIYEECTAGAVGTAVRYLDDWPWNRVIPPPGECAAQCRVALNPAEALVGYAWHGRGFWYVDQMQQREPARLVLAEVMATSPDAADAVLTLCRMWAREHSAARIERQAGEPLAEIVTGLTPEIGVAAAAMHRSARLTAEYQPCGGSMARTLDVGRLLRALAPELSGRARWAGLRPSTLSVVTEIGEASLRIDPEGNVDVTERGSPDAALRLPQSGLARLALGAFPPGDLLDRLREPVSPEARTVVEALFPLRHPHMYYPDRF
jgi:hypothetical protein